MKVHTGQTAQVKRSFTQSDFDRFAELSGDDNPIHIDPEFAARSKFGRTVAHGMFLYSVVCGVLNTQLPGPGTLQIEQELMFPTATPTGEEIEARVEVTGVILAEGLVELSTFIIRPDGNLGLQGRTLVRPPATPALPEYTFSTPGSRISESHDPEFCTFKGMAPGDRAQTQRTFAAADLDEYADLTGDTNPLVTSDSYVRELGIEGQIIPGGLIAGQFSQLLGTRLPGQGTNYLKQRLIYPQLAHVGQELTASVDIVRIRQEKQLVNLNTVCTNPAGQVVCRGEALVLVSDVSGRA